MKNYIKENFLKVITIILSVVALLVSIASCEHSKEANNISSKALKNNEREDMPNFRIIQNLWTDEPYFELVNEATSKLDSSPSPTYFMFIPSKLYFKFKDESLSIMVLSKVDYTAITEQIVQSETKSSIVKSKLPKKFSAKKGKHDVIKGQTLEENEEFKIYIDTLPFLIIVSDLYYEYDRETNHEILLSTPSMSENITDDELENLKRYIHDNEDKLRVPLDENSSIYETAHKQLENLIEQLNSEETSPEQKQETFKIIGGVEDGYGSILKKVSDLISMYDPMEERILEGDKGETSSN